MTVRGYMVDDEYEGFDLDDEHLAVLEDSFRRRSRHEWCGVCHDTAWASRAFVWPRKGFRAFGLDEKPALVQTVQAV